MRTYKSATLNRLKAELKTLAATISVEKPAYRTAYSEAARDIGPWSAVGPHQTAMCRAQHEFRHRHIAYCLLRGRTMDQIENTDRCANEKGHCYMCNHPNQKYIDQLLEECRAEMAKEKEAKEVASAVG
jgi:uncharacterized membrane protein